MISVTEAIQLIENNSTPGKREVINLNCAIDHYLSKDVISSINMPPFRQSAMDGYAVCMHQSQVYTVVDEIKAGDSHQPILNEGEAVRIFTGAPVPNSANAVILQEKVVVKNDIIELQSITILEDNIRTIGEQVLKGAIALKKGTRLNAAAIGYLACLGITEVEVYKRPKITVVVTGNELIEPGKALEYGKIYESNSIMLLSALKNIGYTSVSIHTVEDDYLSTKNTLNTIIKKNDLVLITGGISVGDYDFVGKALKDLSVEKIFYKVKQKPGKPLFYGKKEGTAIFALPGNPAAALSCFYIYVYPALKMISGSENHALTKIIAKSSTNFIKKGTRAQFLKANYSNNNVSILDGQSSAMLQTFALANALVYVPEEQDTVAINDNVLTILLPN